MNYEDEIYHSGYLDGYYASMELYHADEPEMTEEEKAARRKRRRRNIALGIAGAAGIAGAGYYGYKRMQKANEEMGDAIDRVTVDVKRWNQPKPKRTVKGFRKTTGTYVLPNTSYDWIPFAVERNRKLRNRKGFTKSKPRKTVQGFRRNPGTYRFDPNKDFGGFLTLQEMHRKARSRNYKHD